MNDLETINRKIKLKRQVVFISRAEVQRLQLEAWLLKVRQFLERQIDHAEDQHALSRHIDMIEALLEAMREVYR
jgi:hypothetical protein